MYRELPAVSFISAALVLLPLPWHWRARTIPTISLILWMFVSTLIDGINAIVWADNVRIVAPVYCDIATKIMVGSTVALPSSIFCLCVNLERIASLREVRSTNAERRRRKIFDCILCFVVPVIYMALHYVVQGHRFDIVENFGCRPTIYISIASVFIIWIPPALFTIVGGILSAMALRHFFIRRIAFARHLQNSNSALSPSRYFRLIAMALVQTIWSIAVTIVNMWYSLTPGLRPWISWADVHWKFSHVSQFPALLNTKENILLTYLLWWTIPVSSLIFVAFFAFGQDALKEYRACFAWVKRVILRIPEAEKKNLVLLPS
ncbi:GPCR fungal pheromone mating factor [Armillaria mellea]|nr:GPCR fungal pheromone mating factor [Armillaria mellea]